MKLKKALGVALLSGAAASILLLPAGESDVYASTNAEVGQMEAIYAQTMEVSYPDYTSLVLKATFPTVGEYENYLKGKELLNYKDVIINSYDYSSEELQIAAYKALQASNLTISDVMEELNNICVLGQVPQCLDEDVFINAVGKLLNTIPLECNPFEVYAPLAYEVHQINCDKKHVQGEFTLTCESLQEQYEIIGPKSLEMEADLLFGNDPAYQRIKLACINHPSATLGEYFSQLENLVQMQKQPSDLYDDYLWNSLFGLLDSTLLEEESLYSTFIEFAITVHNTFFPDDIYILNDDGVYRSENYLHQ